MRVLIGALTVFFAALVLSLVGLHGSALLGLTELAELTMLGAFAALVATATATSAWDRPARLLLVTSVTFGVSSMIADSLADLIGMSRSSYDSRSFVELVRTRQQVSLVLSAISIIGLGLGIAGLSRLLGRTRHLIIAGATGAIVVALIVCDRLAFELVIPREPTLLLRAGLLALAAIASLSRYSKLETMPRIDRADDEGAGDEPEAWRRAALGLRIIRVAEMARVLLVAVVILLGLVISRSGAGWATFKVYVLGLAMLGIAATELVGLSYLASIPARSGARGPAIAGLAVGLIGLSIAASAFGADLLTLDGVPVAASGFDLDLGPRLTMLVTITALFLALRAIAQDVGATAAARSSALGALFYGLAVSTLIAADTMDRSGELAAPSMLAKLAAFGFFVAALGRLLANLKTAADHLEDQRRHALGSEFS